MLRDQAMHLSWGSETVRDHASISQPRTTFVSSGRASAANFFKDKMSSVGPEMNVLAQFAQTFGAVVGCDAREAKDGEVVREVVPVPAPDPLCNRGDTSVGDTDVPIVQAHVWVPL
jgi:hypothetical protein